VHVTDRLLEVWSGNELIKTLLHASGGEIRKKRAERGPPAPCSEASTITRDSPTTTLSGLD
jgi:hypothetical protein